MLLLKLGNYFQTPNSFILTGSYLEKHYGNKFYGKAQNATIILRQAYDNVLEKYDVLVMPTVPSKAPKLPEKGQEGSNAFPTEPHII